MANEHSLESASEAKAGDVITIDFRGMVNGVAFVGGTASNYNLELGSHQFIAGFEEQLIGAKVGEDRMVRVTFPKDYPSADVAGKEANFAVIVKNIQHREAQVNERPAALQNAQGVQKPMALTNAQIEVLLRHGPELDRIEPSLSPELRKLMVDLQRQAASQYASGEWKTPPATDSITIDVPHEASNTEHAQQVLGNAYLSSIGSQMKSTFKSLMDALGLTPSAPRNAADARIR